MVRLRVHKRRLSLTGKKVHCLDDDDDEGGLFDVDKSSGKEWVA